MKDVTIGDNRYNQQVVKHFRDDGGCQYYLKMKPGVIVVLEDEDGKVLIVKHRRLTMAQASWELIMGHMEDGESPEEATIREVKEEIGSGVDKVTVHGELRSFPEILLAPSHVTRAITNAKRMKLDDIEGIIDAKWLSRGALKQYIKEGQFRDVGSLAALAVVGGWL
ncbi:hypothetical protein LCGC14_2129400 [marine sediment metagenome]|uniref:Nudix hydrolase domain-containing protein n=1 Tax=marine sediment metagenome TaxID=412755 RepID=A0A0F9GY21_9ZZZZ